MSANLPVWERRREEMEKCKNVADLVARHGEPHHKVPQNGFEIWHYPLGVDSGMLYSIHVSVWPDGVRQTYLFFEPTDLADSPPQDTRWQRPAGLFALVTSLLVGYLTVYRPIHAALQHQAGTDSAAMLSVCVPPLLYVGLVLTLFGEKGSRFLGIGQRESRRQLVIVLVLVALGFLLWWWVANAVGRYDAQP